MQEWLHIQSKLHFATLQNQRWKFKARGQWVTATAVWLAEQRSVSNGRDTLHLSAKRWPTSYKFSMLSDKFDDFFDSTFLEKMPWIHLHIFLCANLQICVLSILFKSPLRDDLSVILRGWFCNKPQLLHMDGCMGTVTNWSSVHALKLALHMSSMKIWRKKTCYLYLHMAHLISGTEGTGSYWQNPILNMQKLIKEGKEFCKGHIKFYHLSLD